MAIKTAAGPVVSRKVQKKGKATLTTVSYDMTQSMLAALPWIARDGSIAMVKAMNVEMVRTFQTGADGSWADNTEMTEELKGHARIMEGRTQALLEAIGVVPGDMGGASFARATTTMIRGKPRVGKDGAVLFYGWPETPHPDTSGSIRFEGGFPLEKDPAPSRDLTIADIATMHEFGYTAKVPIPGGTFKEVNVPPRPWLSYAADSAGNRIFIEAALDVGKSLDTVILTGAFASKGGMRIFKGSAWK